MELNELLERDENKFLAPVIIPATDAIQFVTYYQAGIGPNDLKSVWLDREIIDFICNNAQDLDIDGVRLYLAKYKAGVGSVAGGTTFEPNKQTIIVALTKAVGTKHEDIAYFDYANPCPPNCNLGGI
ncbi:MAG: hypothetical protein JST82_01200 [Bacteroidetes bacterium]|nr:hypothetical protein [Bacteroidota bacterium]